MSELTLRVIVDFDDRIIDLLSALRGDQAAETPSTPAPKAAKAAPKKAAPEPEEEESGEEESGEEEVTRDSVIELAGEIASESEDAKKKVKALIKKVGKADALANVKEANLAALHEALTELKESEAL